MSGRESTQIVARFVDAAAHPGNLIDINRVLPPATPAGKAAICLYLCESDGAGFAAARAGQGETGAGDRLGVHAGEPFAAPRVVSIAAARRCVRPLNTALLVPARGAA